MTANTDSNSPDQIDDVDGRAKKILAGLNLRQKISLMSGRSPLFLFLQFAGYGKYFPFSTSSIKKFGIYSLRFIDGPRGIGFKGSTAFPSATGRGAAWDTELQKRVGDVMGYEARAGGANLCGAVCVNILRHPSWGRAQETFGEDPFHMGCMAEPMIKGLQNHVMACVKHFAGNSIEMSRFYVDVRIDERALREVYLPHFRKCIDAGAASVMSAYNKLNGEYCGHSRRLLTDILKTEWGFKGFVVSDFLYGLRNTKKGITAGLDLEMPFPIHYGIKLFIAALAGTVARDDIDKSALRIIREQLRFAALENKENYDKKICGGKEHAAVALEAARKGIVLLKNKNNILPLTTEKIKKVAVIGRLARRANLGDKGSSSVRPPYTVTPLQGIMSRAGAAGVKVEYSSGRIISRAVKKAEEADVVIIIAGFTWMHEGEYIREFKLGGDRLRLDLLDRDIKLISAVSAINENCIVALESGTAVTMDSWIKNVKAVLMLWYPGMEGGRALADILFGDVNPSGKLPITIPKSADQIFPFDNIAETVKYDFYHGYRYFDKHGLEPLFSFGFGISYTKFVYQSLRLSAESIGIDDEVSVYIEISNKGDMAGDEIVQLYIRYDNSKIDRPVKELKGFTRIHLKPGETARAELKINARELACWDAEASDWIVEKTVYTVLAGSSSRESDLTLRGKFRIK